MDFQSSDEKKRPIPPSIVHHEVLYCIRVFQKMYVTNIHSSLMTNVIKVDTVLPGATSFLSAPDNG
jgi:hypothetical protein